MISHEPDLTDLQATFAALIDAAPDEPEPQPVVERKESPRTQAELKLAPVPTQGDVGRLIAYLAERPGFHTATKLAQALDLSDRKVRQLAEEADGVIVSGPGSPGYCHLNHCPAEEINHLTATLIAQAKNMIRRAIKTRRRAHALIR